MYEEADGVIDVAPSRVATAALGRAGFEELAEVVFDVRSAVAERAQAHQPSTQRRKSVSVLGGRRLRGFR
jgi:hypothetical protein